MSASDTVVTLNRTIAVTDLALFDHVVAAHGRTIGIVAGVAPRRATTIVMDANCYRFVATSCSASKGRACQCVGGADIIVLAIERAVPVARLSRIHHAVSAKPTAIRVN